jgi:hypothetical protein
MAGYSSRTLVEKLGIKQDQKVLLVLAPSDYEKTLGPLPRVSLSRLAETSPAQKPADKPAVKPIGYAIPAALAKKAPFDFIQCFCTWEAELDAFLPVLKNLLAVDGMLWISWRKKTRGPLAAKESPEANPLGENSIRARGIAIGLVDVKVCAVDETWSGLKFMFRRKDRPG